MISGFQLGTFKGRRYVPVRDCVLPVVPTWDYLHAHDDPWLQYHVYKIW